MSEDLTANNSPRDDEVLSIETSIRFVVRGEAFDAAEVSTVLGLSPTESWSIGENHRLRDGRQIERPSTVWQYETAPVVVSPDPNDHARHLLAKLEPVVAAVQALRARGGGVTAWVWYEINYHVASIELRSDLLARLAAFTDSVHFSVVCTGGAADAAVS